MRVGSIWILGAWLCASVPAFAQAPPMPEPSGSPSGTPASEPMTSAFAGEPAPFPFWARAEYLAYWVKNAPLPVSLVTGNPNNPTQELLDTNQNLGMFAGFRIGMGAWLDADQNIGAEAGFFATESRTRLFSASSDAAGAPTLAFPFLNQTPGAVGDNLLPIAAPGQFAGSVQIASTLQLWGTEANSVFVLMREKDFAFSAIAGLRYVDLEEKLNISTNSSTVVGVPSTVLSQTDQFNTRNQFYGAQIGGRVNWQSGSFGADLTAKLALGDSHQTVDIQGSSTQTGPGGINGSFPGGFFTQPSNMGRFGSNQFAFIPSVELKAYMLLTSQLRAFVGYDFLYWTQVVRPGNQIDHNVNFSQSAVFGNGVLSGPASPSPLLSRSDFWAQGINFGLEFQF
jgi:Putative beta barrel porin-7 (BBP7)